ncbi:hypothetical protein [Streptomyces sp. NPDC029003]|uniref:hypothetical protein n=1 Tax=Streptomyces sp. NPDC029003 TaxID=3155125 RepID=UPI0033EACBE2
MPRTVHIPRQRGGRQAPPVIVVLAEEPRTLTARAAAASGRWLWKHRLTWAPTGMAMSVWLATGIAHLIQPAAAWWLAPLLVIPAGVWAWAHLRRQTAFRSVQVWRAVLAAVSTAAGAWLVAAVATGPARPATAVAWLLLTGVVQTLWLMHRPTSIAKPSVTPAEETR